MSVVHGIHLADLSTASLRAGVAQMLDPHRDALREAASALVLPDAYYPYHPSTGLVTNPDVVCEIVAELAVGLDLDRVVLAVSSTEFVEGNRAARYLGYERIAEEHGLDLVDLDTVDRVETTVHLTRESVTLAVPAPLEERPVVNVPSVRRCGDCGVDAGMKNLAQATTDSPRAVHARAATRACSPAVTIVDGTYVYAGTPHKPRFLLAGAGVAATDTVVADLFDLDRSEVPHLDSPEGDAARPTTVEGFDVRAVAETLPATDAPDSDDELLSKGYRLYAQLTGDLVPPQMLFTGSHE